MKIFLRFLALAFSSLGSADGIHTFALRFGAGLTAAGLIAICGLGVYGWLYWWAIDPLFRDAHAQRSLEPR